MALARIFTRYPEYTDVLRRQLQEQGYTVELLDPEAAPETVADLEIQMELCDPDEVLRRAAELAAQFQADIAIAPGVLKATVEDLAPVAPQSPPTVSAADLTPVTLEGASPANVADAAVALDQHDTRSAGQTFWALVVRKLGAQLGGWAGGASEILALGRVEFRERLEQARIRMTEMHERRQERLLEMMRRRLETRLRAVELEGVRRAAAAALAQQNMDVPPGFAPAKPSPAPLQGRTWSVRFNRREVVAAGVILAIALGVVGGFTIVSLRAHRDAPFGQGATAENSGFTIQGPQPRSEPPERAKPVVHKPTLKPVAHQARRKERKAPRQKDDMVANDVVVRHVASPKPTPRTQAGGWKHFSDTSN